MLTKEYLMMDLQKVNKIELQLKILLSTKSSILNKNIAKSKLKNDFTRTEIKIILDNIICNWEERRIILKGIFN